MADEHGRLAHLEAATPTPIAQLDPGLQNLESHVVQGVVTIFWPYSLVTRTVAFLLAEHDVLLRRRGGQIRVQFGGAAAKAVAASGLGGGDEVKLSLEGVVWERNKNPISAPASGHEWELRFSPKALLQV
jgi:hypothetical protein